MATLVLELSINQNNSSIMIIYNKHFGFSEYISFDFNKKNKLFKFINYSDDEHKETSFTFHFFKLKIYYVMSTNLPF